MFQRCEKETTENYVDYSVRVSNLKKKIKEQYVILAFLNSHNIIFWEQ